MKGENKLGRIALAVAVIAAAVGVVSPSDFRGSQVTMDCALRMRCRKINN